MPEESPANDQLPSPLQDEERPKAPAESGPRVTIRSDGWHLKVFDDSGNELAGTKGRMAVSCAAEEGRKYPVSTGEIMGLGKGLSVCTFVQLPSLPFRDVSQDLGENPSPLATLCLKKKEKANPGGKPSGKSPTD